MEVQRVQRASSSSPHSKRRFFITSDFQGDLEIAHVVFRKGLELVGNYTED
ncbi:unnamed protein product [Spirodela intermedia]|uniref:Uncharacterized protein n=1 Tax=Spirodela intermedia TaxID=51605 RepID=A0A7I8IL14_SPIIN|nr:unnamed protein product [Spirodela intermedia]CAA6658083.1 unnamed protein product [Spirodela intermedia]